MMEEMQSAVGGSAPQGPGPNPWEQRRETGIVNAFGASVKMLLFKPDEFFGTLTASNTIGGPFLFYMIVAPIVLVFSALVNAVAFHRAFSVITIGLGFITAVVLLFVSAGILHLVALIFGGKGGFYGTFSALAYATAANIFGIIPVLGQIVGGIWGIYIVVIGYKHIHRFSGARAFWAYFSPLFLFGFVGLLAAIAIPNLLRARIAANDALARATLRTMSVAAETYATTAGGRYPENSLQLTLADPPFLKQDFCEETISGYMYTCDYSQKEYTFTATPVEMGTSGSEVYTIQTQGEASWEGQ